VVLVIQSGERAAHHRVPEIGRPLVCGDPAREGLPNAEVPGPPGDLVAERQWPTRAAADGKFACGRGRAGMKFDASG